MTIRWRSTTGAAWSCRCGNRSRFCWWTAISSPSRIRPRPTIWRRRFRRARNRPGSRRPIRVEVVPESQLSHRELADYDVVVLCNVAQFSQREVTALDDFLKQGGGVVVFGGDQVVADNYNRLLYADGKGLLPAVDRPERGRRRQERRGLLLQSARVPPSDHRGVPGPESTRSRPASRRRSRGNITSWCFPRTRRPRSRMAFDNGDPAIVEMTRHRGTVVLVATSADTGWTTWPIHKSYLPVMQQIVMRASAGRFAERNIRVGQPFDQSFPAAGAGAAGHGGHAQGAGRVATKLQAAGGVSQFHFEQTDLAGRYQVQIGPPLSLEIVVRRQPRSRPRAI